MNHAAGWNTKPAHQKQIARASRCRPLRALGAVVGEDGHRTFLHRCPEGAAAVAAARATAAQLSEDGGVGLAPVGLVCRADVLVEEQILGGET